MQSISIIKTDNRRTILQIVNMGQIKELLQNNIQQTLHQTMHRNNNKKAYKNKDNEDNKEIIKKGPLVNDLLFLFSQVNPSYRQLYSNITERRCLSRLIDLYGDEKLRNLISSLPSIVQRPYAPRITTPYELEVKMGKLLLFLKQEESNNQKGGVTKV